MAVVTDWNQNAADWGGSYRPDHSPGSQLSTSWRTVQCRWRSWLTPGSCTDFLSPVLGRNCLQVKKKNTKSQTFLAWLQRFSNILIIADTFFLVYDCCSYYSQIGPKSKEYHQAETRLFFTKFPHVFFLVYENVLLKIASGQVQKYKL